MEKKQINVMTRRDFIRQACCAAVGTAAMTAAIRDLRFMNAAVAQSNINDYKALVCLFLNGGNDANNLIVPTIQSEYDNYAAIRTPVLALPRDGAPPENLIIPINSANPDGHAYGLHPACPELATLFNQEKVAFVFNTGTLIQPVTQAQYKAGLYRPPQLFSHSDQVTQWQTSIPDQPPLTGWGGRCADILAAVQPNAPISLSVTLAGANTFEVGNIVSQYSVGTGGAITLSSVTGARLNAMTNILALPYPNLQIKAFADVSQHAIVTGKVLNDAIVPTAAETFWTVPFPNNTTRPIVTPTTPNATFGSNLGPQMRMIARLIEAGQRSVANGGFGMKRQIFFCQVGGYDLHAGQTPGPGEASVGSHANLLAEVSQCVFAFQRAMEQLGLQDNVTVFTGSDFGRTFPCNGVGSDHGWGSHHMIIGGAVNGRRTYGEFPVLAVNGPDDTSTGRWIPKIAVDQYFATLATWFGVDSGNLATVFPNLGRFSTPNLGFML